jgi:hypothetical protein
MRRPTPAERFFGKVRKTETCWLWQGARYGSGYGEFKVASYTLVAAHRWSYAFHVGPIPAGLVIDHLCRVPLCVNPGHLEAVTQRENTRRQHRPTTCPQGHAFTPGNTYTQVVDRERDWSGRKCRACDRARKRAARAAVSA